MINKFYKMTYSNSGNLGDHIQTIATEQFLDCVGGVERDLLAIYEGEPINLLMQGWFGNLKRFKQMFPPSKRINPVFFGFHISINKQDRAFYGNKNIIKYFKKHQPIGCRDISTRDFLIDLGVDAFFSRCLTTTFPLREQTPKEEKIFIVDCISDMLIPNDILERAEKLTHVAKEDETQLEKENKARLLLSRYKNEATLVITSRLHCASPCIAMGIPVIFIDDTRDIRFTAISDLINISHVNRKLFKFRFLKPIQLIYAYFFQKRINWNPESLNIEEVKQEIVHSVYQQIKRQVK